MSNTILGNKRIIELDPLGKLTGKELTVVDSTEGTFKVTVDSLLGYIAKQINSGTIPSDIFSSCNIIDMPVGQIIPIASRVDGNFYLRTCDVVDAQIAAGMNSTIRVSPNMSLKIVS